jgi:hypothetical protein
LRSRRHSCWPSSRRESTPLAPCLRQQSNTCVTGRRSINNRLIPTSRRLVYRRLS